MHEIGLCEPVVEAVERRAAGRRVTGVRVRVGVRHAVVEDSFEQAFAMAAEGTVAAGAAVDLVITPATVFCHTCGRRAESADPLASCTGCGEAGLEMSGGDELILESIELGTAEPREKEVTTDVSRDSRGDR